MMTMDCLTICCLRLSARVLTFSCCLFASLFFCFVLKLCGRRFKFMFEEAFEYFHSTLYRLSACLCTRYTLALKNMEHYNLEHQLSRLRVITYISRILGQQCVQLMSNLLSWTHGSRQVTDTKPCETLHGQFLSHFIWTVTVEGWQWPSLTGCGWLVLEPYNVAQDLKKQWAAYHGIEKGIEPLARCVRFGGTTDYEGKGSRYWNHRGFQGYYQLQFPLSSHFHLPSPYLYVMALQKSYWLTGHSTPELTAIDLALKA